MKKGIKLTSFPSFKVLGLIVFHVSDLNVKLNQRRHRKKTQTKLNMKVLSLNKVENSVAKGKIAHHEQFVLLPHCFQKSSAAYSSELSISWKGLTNRHILTPL